MEEVILGHLLEHLFFLFFPPILTLHSYFIPFWF